MPCLTNEQRHRAIGMLEAGVHQEQATRHFGVSRRTVGNLVRRYTETGSVNDRPHPGGLRVTSQRQDRAILLQHLRGWFLPASSTAATTVGLHGHLVSERTIRRRLNEQGLDCQHGVHSVANSSVPPIRETASVGHASTCAGHSNAGIAFSLQMSHVSVFLWQMGVKDYGETRREICTMLHQRIQQLGRP